MTRLNTTTRRHPRSLSEAFPDVRAQAIHHEPKPEAELSRLVWGFIAAVIAAFLLFTYLKG